MSLRPAGPTGVFTDGSWFLTRNLVPGVSVYGEHLVADGSVEYRRWDATRSKLAAYLKKGGRVWPFASSSSVLYLGAGSGTTVSHISDLCSSGSIVAVEMSPRVFRDLVRLAEVRRNVLPILGDATKPETYAKHLRPVDVLYQDVAQRDQEAIFVRHMEFLQRDGTGYLMVKARSIDVAAEPAAIYESVRRRLGSKSLEILEVRPLDPFETDHAAIVVRKR